MSVRSMATYPAHRENDVVLRDGSTVRVRPARPDDAPAMERLLAGLSDRSRRLRFFSSFPDTERAVRWATDVDYEHRYGLVATTGGDGRLVGHAGWEREAARPERAEVALEVVDAMQSKGLGTILLGQLAEAAHDAGVEVLEAEVLPENHLMIKVFRDCGFPVTTHTVPGAILVEFPASMSPEARERFERREQVAATAAMRAFFSPRSVAVIGASRERGTVPGELFHNLLAAGFHGPVYPVNPRTPGGPVGNGLPVGPGGAGPGRPGRGGGAGAPGRGGGQGVRGQGGAGAGGRLGRLRRDRARGRRPPARAAVGLPGRRDAPHRPQLPGDPEHRPRGVDGRHLRAHRPPARAGGVPVPVGRPRPGHHRLRQRPRPGAVVVRVGRQQGRHLQQRPALVLGAGRADRAGAAVPGVVRQPAQVRPHRPPGGQDQAGAGGQERPLGRRGEGHLLAHRGAAGGLRRHRRRAVPPGGGDPGRHPGGAVRRGLPVRQPAGPGRPPGRDRHQRRRAGDHVRGRRRGRWPGGRPALPGAPGQAARGAARRGGGGQPGRHAGLGDGRALPADGRADGVLGRGRRGDRHLRPAAARRPGRGGQGGPRRGGHGRAGCGAERDDVDRRPPPEDGDGPRLPRYRFPEDAAYALVRAVEYGDWRRRPPGTVPELPEARPDEAAALLAGALAAGPGGRWLAPPEVARLLACYGLPVAEWRLAGSPEEAVAAAAELGGRVALKAVASRLVHKTEAGAVRLGLVGAEAVRVAAAEMAEAVAVRGYPVEGFLVQPMVPDGVELLVGVVHDASFGPVVACGAGGTAVELLKDVAVRITPLTDRDAAEMVRSLQTFPLLDGYRGAPRGDVAALEDLLLRVSALVDAHPTIAELDCNPVRVLPEGVVVVDARVRIEPARPQLPLAARQVRRPHAHR